MGYLWHTQALVLIVYDSIKGNSTSTLHLEDTVEFLLLPLSTFLSNALGGTVFLFPFLL